MSRPNKQIYCEDKAGLFAHVNQDEDDDLLCQVCFDFFENPVDHTECGLTLCSKCCKRIQDLKQACPSCREPLVNVHPNRSLARIVDKLKVICKSPYSVMDSTRVF